MNNKKLVILIAAIFSLGLLLSSCTKGASRTWQEQYDLGVRYLSEGNYEEAIIAFTAAIEIDPKRAEAYIQLASAYADIEDLESVREVLLKGQAECPDNETIQLNLSQILSKTEDLEHLDISEMLQEDGTICYDDIPVIFSTPFNELEKVLPIKNISNGAYYAGEATGYYRGEKFMFNDKRCDYSFNNDSNDIIATAPAGMTELLGVEIRCLRDSIDESGYYGPIGLMDICFGDSYHVVLEKMGLDANTIDTFQRTYIEISSGIDSFGFAEKNATIRYNGSEEGGSIIEICFSLSEQSQLGAGKYVQLIFGENKCLNQVGYSNDDLLATLFNLQK